MIGYGTRRMKSALRKLCRGIPFLIGIAAILMSASTCNAKDKTMLKIYYFSFDAETLEPVTQDSIAGLGTSCVVKSGSDVEKIKKALQSATEIRDSEISFANKLVRIKIVEAGAKGQEKVIAIVEKTGAARIGESDKMLSQPSLRILRNVVEGSCE